MSRPSKQKRDKAKAKAAHRLAASRDPANHIQSGKVRSVVASYTKFAQLSAPSSLAIAPSRYKQGAKSVDQSHKPRQDAPPAMVKVYPPKVGHESNLLGKPRKPEAQSPDISLGYTVPRNED